MPSTGQKLNYKSSHFFPILQGGPEVIHFTAGVALCVICINVQSLIHVVAYFSLLCMLLIAKVTHSNKTFYYSVSEKKNKVDKIWVEKVLQQNATIGAFFALFKLADF